MLLLLGLSCLDTASEARKMMERSAINRYVCHLHPIRFAPDPFMKCNPYAPPLGQDPGQVNLQGDKLTVDRGFLFQWTLVLCANLVMPLMCAILVTNNASRFGMVAGILCFLFTGGYLGIRGARMRKMLVRGGTATALFQFMPILQMLAGIFSMEVCGKLGLGSDNSDDAPMGSLQTMLSGFVCTILTGSMISITALMIGWLLTIRSINPTECEESIVQHATKEFADA